MALVRLTSPSGSTVVIPEEKVARLGSGWVPVVPASAAKPAKGERKPARRSSKTD